MKKCFVLAKRNIKEMVREPLSFVFCLGFPLVMLLLMQLIFQNIDIDVIPPNFEITSYASGICVFGYTFTSLFVAQQISSDKNTSFMKRITIAPIKRASYYLSFFISALPVALAQTVLFFLLALLFGYPFGGGFFLSILYLLPSAVFYVCVGILIGALCKNEKQASPIASIFVSFTGILGGVFMPITLFGGGFAVFVNILPFGHSVLIASEISTVGAKCIYPHILYILGYIALIVAVVAAVEKIRAVKR